MALAMALALESAPVRSLGSRAESIASIASGAA
jgi:hypothetical protein